MIFSKYFLVLFAVHNMSTHDLEKSGWAPRPVADRLLVLLKTRGPQTAADIGQALGTTGENARQQLSKLAGDGLVAAHSEARGVGRPSQVWQLTDTGQGRFPDTHAELTLQLLRAVRETFGAYALDRLIDMREDDMLKAYRQELSDASDIKERVARLAVIRSREGYMAEWRTDDDGSLLLVENHCPICAAAATCQGFCRSELEVFQDVLGPSVAIERIEHILAGARRCAYRIREKNETA
jgi:predicted ArsR family transcriptional regulator